MKVIYFSVNIEDVLQKAFCLELNVDKLDDHSQIRYILPEDELYQLYYGKINFIFNIDMDVYMYSILESALESSISFRTNFFNYLNNMNYKTKFIKININVNFPKKQILDKRGNKLFEISCLERRELDHAMAWFSTLGGAFSALGDKIEYCAIMAGKISQQQFLFALRLGDPNLVVRCKLYMALSLIQQRKFSLAKKLIKSQYIIAKKEYERDKRLSTMCHGIWTKWRYDKKQAKINGLL